MNHETKKLKISRVLGEKTFAAITAVEGLELAPASRRRLVAMNERKLTQAQKRAEILRAYSSPKNG